MSAILDRINRRFRLLAEQNDLSQPTMQQRIAATAIPESSASWKNPDSPEYDRQVAEDALFHTVGPLTNSPQWVSGPWTSASTPVPEFRPGAPAPRWTEYEVVMAFAGDPAMLFRGKDNPRSPMYGSMGGSPMFRLAKRVARIYARDSDRSFIEDLYGNGFVALTTLMKPGYDESRSPFISFAMRNIQSAMEHGIGGSERTSRAAGDVSKETGLRGMQSLMKETNPQRVRQAAEVVKGKYRETRSHDKNADNPFGPFSSAYYQIAMNYADALESGDEERIDAARNRMQQLIGDIEDYEIPVRGASTGLGQAISTPDRMKKYPEGHPQAGQFINKRIGIQSMDVSAGDEGGTLAGNVPMDDSMESWIDPETINYILDIAINYDLGKLLGSSPKYKQVAVDFQRQLAKIGGSSLEKKEDKIKIGGPLTVNELRYLIRKLGPLGSNYPGRGVPRERTDIPRDSGKWWQPGEDPEIEPIPSGGLWHSIWSRNGYQAMGPNEVVEEMTRETQEFIKLGIPSGRADKVAAGADAVGKVAISTTSSAAQIKFKLIAHIHRHELGLDESIRKDLPILEGLSTIDRSIIAEVCDWIVARLALMEVSPPGWKGTTRAMKRHKKFQKGGEANPYAIAWSAHKNGAEPHYKDQEGKPEKKKEYVNEDMKPIDTIDDSLWQ